MLTTCSELLSRVRDAQDEVAWSEFHRLYYGLIHSYARSRGLNEVDASDVTADCMHVLVSKMPVFQYDPKRGRFRAWLKQIVNNRVNNLLKKRHPQIADPARMIQLADPLPGPDDMWEEKWMHAHMLMCLARIKRKVPSKQFAAFLLYALEDWSVDEVSHRLDMTPNQIYIAKSRLTARLREEMSHCYPDIGSY